MSLAIPIIVPALNCRPGSRVHTALSRQSHHTLTPAPPVLQYCVVHPGNLFGRDPLVFAVGTPAIIAPL